MASPNFNADDPRNPLIALLAGRPMTGSTGFNVGGASSTLGMGGGGFSAENGDAAGPGRVTPDQMAILRGLGLTTDTQMESPVTSFDGRTIAGDDGATYQVDPTGDIRVNGKLYSQLNGLNVGGPGGVKDPSRVIYDPRFGALTEPDNINNIFDTGYGNAVFAAGAAGLALPTLAAALGGASSGGMGANVASTDAGATGASASTGAGASTAQTQAAIDAANGVGGGGGGAAGAAAPGAGAAGAGASTAETQAAVDAANGVSGAGGVGGSAGNFLSRAGSYIASHPMDAARVGLGLASLGAASHGGSGSPGAAGGDMNSIIEQMAMANRVNQNTPIGSRQWVHNPDGTWTVNDTMSAPEQANFENVQGLNASVTDMARQRLAAFLAHPYDFSSVGRGGYGG